MVFDAGVAGTMQLLTVLTAQLDADSIPDLLLLTVHAGMARFGFIATETAFQEWRIKNGAGHMYAPTYRHGKIGSECTCSIRGMALGESSLLLVGTASDAGGFTPLPPVQLTLTLTRLPPRSRPGSALEWPTGRLPT
eukprot:TRINITY_DN19116_c1_g1_i1.p2 TRINITY_DN19116_c1_g1~~TRINITY_DN19116_c1_g1_i1.p2  ORF type:complete len:137 (+),score=22.42 TRINITY_DN19116_c1_g1_i1:149-559(+)